MNGRVTKARTRRSRATPKAVQAKLLDAAADKSTELLQSHREQSLANGGFARDTTPVPTAKRQRDAPPKSDPLPVKRARLTRAGTQWVRVKGAEQAEETTRQHPKPKPPKRRDTSLPEFKAEGQKQAPPTTWLRKRQIGDGDDEHEPKRARLTQKNLARFNKMGKKKGSNKASTHDSADESTTTKTISTSSSGFAVQAYENHMLHPSRSQPPTNVQNIRERHDKSRETASPPGSAHERYVDRVGGAGNEATMVFEVGGRLLKDYDDKGYQKAFNRPFTAFPEDVGFNNGLSAPQPDFVEGLEMQDYDPFPVHKHVDGAVLYSDDRRSVTLPHLAGEWKGRGKDMEKAALQAGYDGAALVYARNQALSYLEKPDPPGHAEVTTFTTDGTTLNFFAHYATPSKEDGTLEYHQYQYASTNVKDTHQGHKDGYKGIRNVQDHARDQSYALRDQLKGHWKQRRSGPQPIAEGDPLAGLDDILEEPLPAQESKSYPRDDDEIKEPPPSTKPARPKRTNRKAPPAYRTDDESGYEIIGRPSYAPTPPRSSEERRRSTRLSNSRPLSSKVPANTTAKKHKSSSRGKAETTTDY